MTKIMIDSIVEWEGEQWTVGNFCPETQEYGLVDREGGPNEDGDWRMVFVKEADLVKVNGVTQ